MNKAGVTEAKYLDSVKSGRVLEDSPYSCCLFCKKPVDIEKLQTEIEDLKKKIIEMREKVQSDKKFTGLVFVTLDTPKSQVTVLNGQSGDFVYLFKTTVLRCFR